MILYIHPQTDMLLKEIIPLSLPALVNRLRLHWEVLGRFCDEWTAAEVKAAPLVLMDIHWYLSVASAIRLSRELKAINPAVRIVAGGASASVFSTQILRDSEIDYIIRGDAEIPLERLAKAVMECKNGEPDISCVPNLMMRGYESSDWYCLTKADLDANDFCDISWFPTLKRRCERLHGWSKNRTYPVYPSLMPFRGCPMRCNCLGSVERQNNVFRRSWLMRSPEKVREDLIAYSNDPKLHFVNVFMDFLTVAPVSYVETVLDRPYDLNVYIELFSIPAEHQLDLLIHSFKGGNIHFTLDTRHGSSPELGNMDDLIARINQVKATRRFEMRVSYVESFFRQDPVYAAACRRVARETHAPMERVDFWWYDLNPDPDEHGFASEEEYQEALRQANGYRFFNILFKASVHAHRFFPGIMPFLFRLFTHTNFGSPIRALELKNTPH